MPSKVMETAPETAPATDTVFERDLYLLAPLKLPKGQQYAVGSSDGQMLLLVKRGAGGRGVLAFLASMATGLIILGFISSFGDSLGGPVIKWAAVVLGAGLGFLAAVAVYPALLGNRLATFSRKERPSEKVLEVKQADRSRAFEVSCTITGAKGRLLGTARRNYLASLLRTHWVLFGAAGAPMVVAREAAMGRAIGARLFGWAVPTLRSNFELMSPDGAPLGLLERRELVQGRVMFDLRQGGRGGLDPQLGLALAVLIDLDER
jgi:hypothetical protein